MELDLIWNAYVYWFRNPDIVLAVICCIKIKIEIDHVFGILLRAEPTATWWRSACSVSSFQIVHCAPVWSCWSWYKCSVLVAYNKLARCNVLVTMKLPSMWSSLGCCAIVRGHQHVSKEDDIIQKKKEEGELKKRSIKFVVLLYDHAPFIITFRPVP